MEFLANKRFSSGNREKFLEKVKEEDSKKKTLTVDIGKMQFTKDGTLAIKKKKQIKDYPCRLNGIETLLSFLKMPVKFYLKVAPDDMMIRDINRMLAEIREDKEILVHLSDKEVRGISRATCVVKPSKIFEENMFGKTFIQGMYDEKGVRVTSASKRNIIEPKPGDVTRIGMRAKHSDIAQFGTNVVPFLYRLICKNGVVVAVENPYVTNLRMRISPTMSRKDVISTFNDGVSRIELKSNEISDGLDFMNDSPLAFIPNSLTVMSRVRSVVGSSMFDEGLGSKMIIEHDNPRGKKTKLINPEYNAYDAYNKTTRMAKKLHLMDKDKVESLAGELVISATSKAATRK